MMYCKVTIAKFFFIAFNPAVLIRYKDYKV